ncbi:MAG TPA: N-acetylneuraminate synthase family protein [Candidatus Ozemobacteraceae bacterium]|nr:N-acetylneuraminate synthase family protein [Candidatus Ozemobacteraceae bacterium]
MNLAVELIHAAKESGADAAKFQLYSAPALFPKEGNPWYEYNCKTELSRDQVFLLANVCRKAGIEFLASAFDEERIGWLEEAGVRRHKVASRSIKDEKLLRAFAATGKPLLVSLGMWDGRDFPTIPTKGNVDFLYCVSLYPTPLEAVKLSTVDFSKYVGFSDHTVGIAAAMAAFSRGARIVEKHFTLDKKAYGPDHEGSMVPSELKSLDEFRKNLARLL